MPSASPFAAFLTQREQDVCAKHAIRFSANWLIENEPLTFADTPEHCTMRAETTTFNNNKLRKAANRIAEENADLEAIVSAVDWDAMDDHDMSELLFILGPTGISFAMGKLLRADAGVEELELALQLSIVRHDLLLSLQNPVTA